jgi:hypothetical protein
MTVMRLNNRLEDQEMSETFHTIAGANFFSAEVPWQLNAS